ncbi:hypothetical protein D043_0239A, partial [Vibrio parahaemolyticus EKP-021]
MAFYQALGNRMFW